MKYSSPRMRARARTLVLSSAVIAAGAAGAAIFSACASPRAPVAEPNVVVAVHDANPAPSASTAPETTPMKNTSAETTTVHAYGCDLEVALVPAKTDFTLGEPVMMTFRVTTSSCAKKLSVLDGGDYRNDTGRAETYKMQAIASSGDVIAPRDGGPQFGGMSGPRALANDKPFEKRLLITHWIQFPAAGKYTLIVNKDLFVGETMTPDEKDKTVLPVKVSTSVNVLPASNEALGAVIQTLGTDMLKHDGDNDDAMVSLRALHDDRVIPYFITLLDSGGTTQRFSAVWGLQPYGTDEAVAAIAKTIDLPDMKLTAAQALAGNPAEKAWKTLWTLRSSKDENVRLTVLHALAKRKDADVPKRLTEFTKDPSPMVAGEAKRYLRERKP